MNEDRVLSLVAILLLMIGIGYYLLFRTPIIASYWFGVQEWHSRFGLYTLGWLPSFVHQFSFVLLTWIALDKTHESFAIWFWLMVNSLFEFGQILKGEVLGYFPNVIANYFKNGTFAGEDLVAIWIATLIAYGVIKFNKKEKNARA